MAFIETEEDGTYEQDGLRLRDLGKEPDGVEGTTTGAWFHIYLQNALWPAIFATVHDGDDAFATVRLTASEARTMAASLIEGADMLDAGWK